MPDQRRQSVGKCNIYAIRKYGEDKLLSFRSNRELQLKLSSLQNQRHTWQSWRDRYVKYLQHKPPVIPNTVEQVENGQSHTSEAELVLDQQQTPVRRKEPAPNNHTSAISRSPTGMVQQYEPETSTRNEIGKVIPRSNVLASNERQDKYSSFTREDFDYLLKEAEDILNVSYGGFDKAWQDYVEYYQKHSTWDVWRDFFQEKVLPVYREMTTGQEESGRQTQGRDETLFVDQQDAETMSSTNGLKKEDVTTFEESAKHTEMPMNGSPNLASPARFVAESLERSNQSPGGSPKIITPSTRKRTRSLEGSSQSSRSAPSEKRQRFDYSELVADEMQEVEESDPEGRNGIFLTPKQHIIMPSIMESTHDTGDDQGSIHPSEELGEQIQKEGIVNLDMKTATKSTETHQQEKLQELRYSHTTVTELRRQAQTRSMRMSSSAEPESSPPVHSDRTISVERDTQAILNAATQAVDFDIPSPLVEREENEGDKEMAVVGDEEAGVVEDEIVEEAVEVAVEGKGKDKVESEESFDGKEEEHEEEVVEEENDDDFASQNSPHLATQAIEPPIDADIDFNSANQHDEGEDQGRDEGEDQGRNEDEDKEIEYLEESTAKPQARARDTQALLAADTQIIDFEVPEPIGGFVDDASENDISDHDNDNSLGPERINKTSSQGNTHINITPISHSAQKPHSPLSLSASELDDQINNFIDAGYAEPDIIAAMKCTSLDLHLTARLLPLLEAYKHIPGDMRGVWTAEDDAALEGGNGRSIKLVAEKHGWAACDVRLRFLDEWRG